MSWIEEIRKKPDEEKRKLIRTILIISLVLLVAIWIIVGNYNPSSHGSDFFGTLGDILHKTKDIKVKP